LGPSRSTAVIWIATWNPAFSVKANALVCWSGTVTD
jgi:hypothetical protein